MCTMSFFGRLAHRGSEPLNYLPLVGKKIYYMYVVGSFCNIRYLSVCLKSLLRVHTNPLPLPSSPSPPIHLCCSLHTDMLFGHRNGLRTLLVFSGVTKRSDLPSAKQEEQPEFICDSVASLLTCKP